MYEAQQALLDAEYNARVEQEQRLIAEAKQRAKEEEERRRQEAERQRLAVEEERRKREEAERAEREAAARRKIEERKRLEKEKRHFAVRTEGQVRVERPPKGTLLQGRLQKEASVRVAVTAGSLLGGAGVEITADFTSLDDAVAAMPALVGAKARAASDGLMSALRLQALAGDGPMSAMEQPEQEHWMAMTAARTAVVALKAGEAAVENFRNNPKAAMHAQPFQVRTEIGVLAPDHPQGPAAVLGRAIALVEEGSSNQAVEDVLADSMQAENEQFYAGLEPLPNALAAAPKALGAALELAHFLARALHDRPAKSSDAPAWFEACASLVRQQLTVLLRGAPADSLAAPAAVLSTALGPANPISVDVAALAEANVSAAERARRAEQERAYQVELAAKLLEEEWPDAAEIRAARLQERESKTPIAERVWALRNVAGTLAMGGPGERSRARQLLEQAVLVKQEFAGAPDHPAALPELVALADVLASDSEWAQDAAGVASLLLRVLGNIASAYAQAGDPVSAALLMEAGLRQYEEAAGVKSAAVRAATRRADQLLEGLSSEQRAGVAAQRGQSKALVAKVAKDLTEQLGAYQEGTAKSRAQDWDERGAAMLSSLAN